jgi:penicillin amidase
VADTLDGAWWGLGYAAAQDRLWQMEYDRRRSTGRWAEVAGADAVAADVLARRLQIASAARLDILAMDDATRQSFESYAAGVNAGVSEAASLPPEYARAGIPFEPWESWHSVAAFKIRHVLMGVWQYKLARAVLHACEGREAFDTFDPTPREGMLLTTPAGERVTSPDSALLAHARDDVAAAAAELGFLAEVEAGSNAWAVSGIRTRSGKPLLVNDSHRAVDVPNVYWQARIETAELHVAGATFPGIPGFPHFGHNGRVGWAITNAAADAQDLVLEAFRDVDGALQSRTTDGWAEAQTTEERIEVANGGAVDIECVRTVNGPVVHGDPRSGRALSLRWTATKEPCRQFHVLEEMLSATTVHDFLDAQAGWVDPVNNLLCADVEGNIGYLLRGCIPRRRRSAGTQIPVPGWEADSQWEGNVPFQDLPREVNPPLGFIANANNTVTCTTGGIEISHSVNDFYRAERIYEVLQSSREHDAESMRRLQCDTVSIPARLWSAHLAQRGELSGDAEPARRVLVDWDGELDAPRPAGLLYACFRRALAAVLLQRHLGPTGRQLLSGTDVPAGGVLLKRWFAQLIWPAGDDTPAHHIDDATLSEALTTAWADAARVAGSDPAAWRWRHHHRLEPQHTLAGTGKCELPSPLPAAAAGDAETVRAAAYGWPRHTPFKVTNTSVYRQLLDFAALDESRWIIPGGACGSPHSPHYQDQLPLWESGRLIPMSGACDSTQ